MQSFFFDTDIGRVILTFLEALALLVPLLISWTTHDTALVSASYGIWSIIVSLAAVGA